jgi:hypothetical protein
VTIADKQRTLSVDHRQCDRFAPGLATFDGQQTDREQMPLIVRFGVRLGGGEVGLQRDISKVQELRRGLAVGLAWHE